MIDTDFLCEKRLKELNPLYNRIAQNIAIVLYNVLEKYKLYFPDYTDHTVLHSLHVLEFCNKLVGENAYKLNEDELFVLIMSAYLHDCGMGISESDYAELYDTVVNSAYLASHPHVNIKETIRSFHHSFSKKMIYKYAELFDIPTTEHVNAIAIVSESHRKTNLFDEKYLPSVIEMPNGNQIRLPYIASLIRLADELDIASDRNLGTDDSGQETIFKLMHRSIRTLHIFPDRFELEVDTDDPALYNDIIKETSKLKETLINCVDVVKKRTPFEITQQNILIKQIPTPKNRVVVLDTDLGTDDACALLLIKNLPIKPDYVVASYGNTSLEGACKNSVLLKKYLGAQYKTVSGLPAPSNSSTEKNTFHGKDGLADCSDAMARKLNITADDFGGVLPFSELEKILGDADSITYISIGTLTNLSYLLKKESILPRFSGIYVMGGGIAEFNCSHDTEFNFSKDPESVKALLSAGLNITLFPLDVTNHQRLSESDIDELEKTGAYPEYVAFLRQNLKSNLEYNQIPAAVLHDVLPVLYLSYPDEFTLEDMRLISNDCGHIEISGDGETLHVCTSVSNGFVVKAMKKAFDINKKKRRDLTCLNTEAFMKKFTSILCLLLSVLLITACNKSEPITSEETTEKQTETAAETDLTVTVPETDADEQTEAPETTEETTAKEEVKILERTIDSRYFIYRIWNFTKNSLTQFKYTVDAAEAAGFNAIKVHIPWSWVEQTDGQYNFDDFDAMIDYVVTEKGMGVAISLDMTRTQGDTVIPESEIMVSRTGEVCVGGVGGNRMQISFASEHAVNKCVAFYKTSVEHYENLFGNTGKILFYLPAFSLYCETEYWCVNEYDYSDNAVSAFREYMKSEFATVEELNQALSSDFTSFESITPPSTKQSKGIGEYWYAFRHNTLKACIDKLADAQKSVNPNSKFSIQLGCVYDDAAWSRCTFGFADLCEKVDVLWCDDGPTMDHVFSMNYVWSALPANLELAQEIDGPSQVGASPENYLKQGQECFGLGCKYVSIANWAIDATFETYKPVWKELSETWLSRSTPETVCPIAKSEQPLEFEILLSKVLKSGTSSYRSSFTKKLEKNPSVIIKIVDDLKK